MTILGELVLFATALSAIMFRRDGGLGDDAPNPAKVARLIAPTMEQQISDMSPQWRQNPNPTRQIPFAKQKPASTIEDQMDAIEDTDAILARTIDEAERLIEQKRTMVAALRTRLDIEDADIAARQEQIVRLRAALRQEPAVVVAETSQEEPAS